MTDSAHVQRLMTTGFSLGLLHVLTGPDHLSALAALSVGSSYKAFMLGFRWGIGHSSGLIVVAIIFIALKGDLDLRKLGRYCDVLVGIFMIVLGCYGVLGAIKTYQEKRNKRDHDIERIPLNDKNNSKSPTNSSRTGIQIDTELKLLPSNKSLSSKDLSSINSPLDEESSFLSDDEYSNSSGKGKIKSATGSSLDCSWCPLVDMHDPSTQKIVSFSIGLLHGVAGPGGILGVLPAVEMRNWTSSCLYLGSFIFTSTLSMGTFAALYGESTKRLGATAETVELGLSVFSSGMSIAVGLAWFSLSLMGKLETLFH